MNKLIITAIVALFITSAFAQKPQRKGSNMDDMTPAQMAELETKRMTLNLDLTEAQQKKVYDINLENAERRIERRKELQAQRNDGVKPSEEEFLKRKNERLDFQIEHQNKLKKVLNEKQYETWKQNSSKRRKHVNSKMKNRNNPKACRGEKKGRGQGQSK